MAADYSNSSAALEVITANSIMAINNNDSISSSALLFNGLPIFTLIFYKDFTPTTTSLDQLAKVSQRQNRFQKLFYTARPKEELLRHWVLRGDSLGKTVAFWVQIALAVYIVAANAMAIAVLIYGMILQSAKTAVQFTATGGQRLHSQAPTRLAAMSSTQLRGSISAERGATSRRRSVVIQAPEIRKSVNLTGITMDRTATGYLLSLSITDLLLGLLVVPIQVVVFRNDGRWYLGHLYCDFWRATDIFLCTSSTMHTAIIAVDRWYNAISRDPEKAFRLQKTLIVFIWTFSAMISFPVLYLWQMESEDEAEAHLRRSAKCEPVSDPHYILLSALISFFVPLAITLVFYLQIAMLLRKRWLVMAQRNEQRFGSIVSSMIKTNDISVASSVVAAAAADNLGAGVDGICKNREIQRVAKLSSTLKQGRNIVRAMIIVVIVYSFCWLPLYVTLIAEGFCHCIATNDFDTLINTFNWLGYASAGINPLVYILSLKEYRAIISALIIHAYEYIIHLPKKLLGCFRLTKLPPKFEVEGGEEQDEEADFDTAVFTEINSAVEPSYQESVYGEIAGVDDDNSTEITPPVDFKSPIKQQRVSFQLEGEDEEDQRNYWPRQRQFIKQQRRRSSRLTMLGRRLEVLSIEIDGSLPVTPSSIVMSPTMSLRSEHHLAEMVRRSTSYNPITTPILGYYDRSGRPICKFYSDSAI